MLRGGAPRGKYQWVRGGFEMRRNKGDLNLKKRRGAVKKQRSEIQGLPIAEIT